MSCAGRCDRAPAACISIHQPRDPETVAAQKGNGKPHEHEGDQEHYFFGRKGAELAKIVEVYLSSGLLPKADRDADLPYKRDDWMIDAYKGQEPDYAAVKKVAAARRASLEKAASILETQKGFSAERAERFRLFAERRGMIDLPVDAQIRDAVRAWQTDADWAKGVELGAWMDPFLDELDAARADLRGLGGAGIPATQKWRDIRDAIRTLRKRREKDDRGFIVVNGDESEPCTFKDREILLRAPHTVLEAVILAGLFTEATQGFIYIRHEYPEQIKACEDEIRRAEALGVCGLNASVLGRPFPVSVFTSPGGYICGEQSALIEAMSDRRAEPRNMPPKLETNGLDDQPTLVSNVETYAWVPYILINGGQKYAELGVNGCKGRRFFSITGDVKRPGVYEVPMGMTLRELIYGEKYCQGMAGDKKLRAFAPSGPSGGFIPAKLTATAGLPRKHTENKTWQAIAQRRGFDPNSNTLDILDLELELNVFRALSPTQALGAGLMVYAEGRDMVEQAVNAIKFFRNESCGKCVPCRIGSQKLSTMGNAILDGKISQKMWQEELMPTVKDLSEAMVLASICGLGRSVPVPIKTVTEFFPDDLARHLNNGQAKAKA
jgi:NADH:ubiquinone oxidoreductase subunit F (NADH-binding)